MPDKILIIDDAEFVRSLMADLARAAGYTQVAEAENGQEGFDEYKKFKPDVVTIDLVMPQVSGLDALKWICDYDPNARVVVVSSDDNPATIKKALELGAKAVLIKPFQEKDFLNVLNEALK